MIRMKIRTNHTLRMKLEKRKKFHNHMIICWHPLLICLSVLPNVPETGIEHQVLRILALTSSKCPGSDSGATLLFR